MPQTHLVARGECISSIAKRFGFRSWRTIYEDAENAALRQKRPDPNLLAAGDLVIIPDKQQGTQPGDTGRRHVFFVRAEVTTLRIALKGLKPHFYRLIVDGVSTKQAFPSSGIIEQPISPDAQTGQLTLWLTDDTTGEGLSWDLALGRLDPVEEISGVKARLNNLGCSAGIEDHSIDQSTQQAVELFQTNLGKPATGAIDSALEDDLRRAHDQA